MAHYQKNVSLCEERSVTDWIKVIKDVDSPCRNIFSRYVCQAYTHVRIKIRVANYVLVLVFFYPVLL